MVAALALDEFAEIYVHGIRAHKRSYWNSWLPQHINSKNSAHNALQNLYRAGYLEKIIKKGKPHLRITPKGEVKLKRDFNILHWQKHKWDQCWRLVIFDIPQKKRYKRDKLREKLVELGFACWQRSIYLSPYDLNEDVYEFLEKQQLYGQAFVLTARHELLGEAKELAAKIWNIDKLEEKYDSLYQEIKQARTNGKQEDIRKIKDDFISLMREDPHLPLELLPEDWIGLKVQRVIVKL